MRRLIAMTLVVTMSAPEVVLSDPPTAETWFEPAASLTGSTAERFGSSIACSGPVGSYSYIAVGAPEYNNGEGRVYIYSSQDLSTPIQTITAGSPAAGNRFGASVVFTKDLNGDDRADLIISEPRPSGYSALLHTYLSQSSGSPYFICGISNLSLVPGSATELLPLVKLSGALINATSIIAGSPLLNKIETITITNVGGVCTFSDDSATSFSAQGSVSSLFGGALAEIEGANVIDSDVAVGAPNTNTGSGYVGFVPLTSPLQDIALGTVDQRLGTSLAGDPINGHFAYNIPNDDLLRIQRSDGSGSYGSVCNAAIPMNDMPVTAFRGLRLLGAAFSSFLGGSGSDVAYASYRTQPDTGGSVALLSTQLPSSCGTPRSFNNCIFDANQAQGQVLAGGSTCVQDVNGASIPMLLVGSPGWSSDAGRIDIVLEGTQLASAKVCSASTPTPTPTPTAATATPIPIGSGSGGLPAPTVESVGTKSVTLALPSVQIGASFVTFLSKKLKVSRTVAERLASSATLTYEVTLSPSVRASSAELNAMAVAAKLQKVRTRKQRVTVSRLAPGTTYVAKYRVEISIKKPKKTFFTKQSSSTTVKTSS